MRPLDDETQELRQCVRDLVALSTLPAVWISADARTIAESLGEVLLRVLSLDVAYVCVRSRTDGPSVEAAHNRQGAEPPSRTQEIGRALAPWLTFDSFYTPLTVPSPVESGTVRLVVLPLGYGHDFGFLAAGSGRADFPTETERLHLRVGANQAAAVLQRMMAEDRLREEVRITETLNRIGRALSAELDPRVLVQKVTDEATSLTDAEFGALFYNTIEAGGESYQLQALSGRAGEAFEGFPNPRNTAVFAPTFQGKGVVRLEDVTQDPRYGRNAPYLGMPGGHPLVRSYLAVPVVSRTGEVLGGLFFGHARPGVFTERHEHLVVGVAAQAAVAIDNARLHERTQESEWRLRVTLSSIGDAVIATDAAGRITFLNPEAEQLTGWKSDEASRQPLGVVFRIINQQTREPAEHPVEKVLHEGRIVGLANHTVLIARDGTERPIDDSAAPILGDRGTITGVVLVFRDASEKRRAEAAIRRAEQTARFLADASAILSDLSDSRSALRKIASRSVPSFADWCLVDLLTEDGRAERVAVAHADPEKGHLALELHHRYSPHGDGPHGTSRPLSRGESELVEEITDSVLAVMAHDDAHLEALRGLGLRSLIGVPLISRGKWLGSLVFMTAGSGQCYNADDLQAAEDLARRTVVAIENASLYHALREDDRRKDEFLATLAHELRNPLAPIRNAIEIFRLASGNQEAMRLAQETMQRQLQHLVRLVDDLLDLSRVSRGKIQLNTDRVDLETVLRNAIETSRPLIEAAGHELAVVLPTERAWLQADATRLTQVVANLLNNAAKYTRPGGRIKLTAAQNGREAVLQVQDTGIGIPANMLPRIFEMFTQVDSALERSQGGLGIGLTLVKTLVEMHGGTVEARSAGLGKGSEFTVRLPIIAEDRDVPARTRKPEADHRLPPNVRRILVVDDNVDSAESLALLLKLLGNDTRLAHDGPSAVEAARTDRPDVVLLDIGLPGMSGYEVARQIRELPLMRNVMLVAITGWGQEQDRLRAREAGFDHHLTKPADLATLEALLGSLPAPARK